MTLIVTISGCASYSFNELLYDIGTVNEDQAPSYDSYMVERQVVLDEIKRKLEKKKEEKRIKKILKSNEIR